MANHASSSGAAAQRRRPTIPVARAVGARDIARMARVLWHADGFVVLREDHQSQSGRVSLRSARETAAFPAKRR